MPVLRYVCMYIYICTLNCCDCCCHSCPCCNFSILHFVEFHFPPKHTIFIPFFLLTSQKCVEVCGYRHVCGYLKWQATTDIALLHLHFCTSSHTYIHKCTHTHLLFPVLLLGLATLVTKIEFELYFDFSFTFYSYMKLESHLKSKNV